MRLWYSILFWVSYRELYTGLPLVRRKSGVLCLSWPRFLRARRYFLSDWMQSSVLRYGSLTRPLVPVWGQGPPFASSVPVVFRYLEVGSESTLKEGSTLMSDNWWFDRLPLAALLRRDRPRTEFFGTVSEAMILEREIWVEKLEYAVAVMNNSGRLLRASPFN